MSTSGPSLDPPLSRTFDLKTKKSHVEKKVAFLLNLCHNLNLHSNFHQNSAIPIDSYLRFFIQCVLTFRLLVKLKTTLSKRHTTNTWGSILQTISFYKGQTNATVKFMKELYCSWNMFFLQQIIAFIPDVSLLQIHYKSHIYKTKLYNVTPLQNIVELCRNMCTK